MTQTTGRSAFTVRSPLDVEQLPWEDLHGTAGVRTRVLWRSGSSLSGILMFEPGAALPSHAHEQGHHHVYVISGTCRVGENVLGEGSYVHIPAGEPHDLAAADPDGCQVFYLYAASDRD